MGLLLLAWPTGHMMAPVTEIWIQEEEEERWGWGDFELSFRHVELEMPA